MAGTPPSRPRPPGLASLVPDEASLDPTLSTSRVLPPPASARITINDPWPALGALEGEADPGQLRPCGDELLMAELPH